MSNVNDRLRGMQSMINLLAQNVHHTKQALSPPVDAATITGGGEQLMPPSGQATDATMMAAMGGGMPPGMPPGMPMDPAMMGGGMPPGMPMDPAMMGGGMPPGMPMDPAMMGAPPMDPAMMGAPPPPTDPAAGLPGAPEGAAAIDPNGDTLQKMLEQLVILNERLLFVMGQMSGQSIPPKTLKAIDMAATAGQPKEAAAEEFETAVPIGQAVVPRQQASMAQRLQGQKSLASAFVAVASRN